MKYKQDIKSSNETKEIIRKQFTIEPITKAEETDEGLVLDFVISTESVDRDQDSIKMDGWELENYRKNPTILWAHDSRTPPIAKSLKEWVEDGKLKSRAQFTPKELNPFGYMIGQMYQKGFLNAVSVGFRSLEAKWSPDEENRPWGVDFFKQELLEYSAVPVPANPEALLDAKAAGVDTDLIIKWAENVLTNKKAINKSVNDELFIYMEQFQNIKRRLQR